MNARVMVVDDDPVVRRVIASALGRAGFEVCTADDGLPALRLVEIARPTLVVVDYNMPTNGLQVVRRCKALFGDEIHVAVLTGDENLDTYDLCREAGADAVYAKPISLTELRRHLTVAAAALKPAA